VLTHTLSTGEDAGACSACGGRFIAGRGPSTTLCARREEEEGEGSLVLASSARLFFVLIRVPRHPGMPGSPTSSAPGSPSPAQTSDSPDLQLDSSSSSTGSPPLPTLHRVKVYRLTEPDAWQDLGTGRCAVRTTFPDQDNDLGPWIVVLDEEAAAAPSSTTLAKSNIIFRCPMRAVYQKAANVASLAIRKASEAEAEEWRGFKGLEKAGAFARQQGAQVFIRVYCRGTSSDKEFVPRHAYRLERPEWKGHGS
jgi:hypothetical protein